MNGPAVRAGDADAATTPATPLGPPSRVRHWVLFMLVLHYGNTYMDRVAIAAAAPLIREEFSIDAITLGAVFSAFTLGYALFQVPGGWLADRFGPRRMITAIVMYWCLFTALTAAAWNITSLIVIRFLFGTGEAGAFPAATRAFSRWLPSTERGFAQGITHSGARLAGALTPPAVAAMMLAWGWRPVFVVFALVGVAWAIGWYWYYRDRPEEHAGVSEAELAIIHETGAATGTGSPLAGHARGGGGGQVPWRLLLRSSNLWTISLMYFCYAYTLWIYLSWLPTYLVEERGFGLLASGVFAGLPLFAGAITNTLGGVVSDRMIKSRGLRFARRSVAITGFLAGVAFIIPGVLVDSPILAVTFLTLAAAGIEFTTGVSWAVVIDVGKDHAGTVSAFMNMCGNLGGALSPLIFGILVQKAGSWTAPFLIASALCVVAALCWLKIDPEQSVVG